VELKLKTPWRDGTTHLVMSPLEWSDDTLMGSFAASSSASATSVEDRAVTADEPDSSPKCRRSSLDARKLPLADESFRP